MGTVRLSPAARRDRMGDTAENITDKMGDTTENITDKVGDTAEKITDSGSNPDQTTDAASEQTQKMGKTVEGIISKVKDDAAMSDSDKINTLSLLLQKFVAENGVLKNEVTIVTEQMGKHIEAKNTLKAMNDAYKKQIVLIKEECNLRIEEEQSKRQESMGGYTDTMSELSTLLDTHSNQNSQMRTENSEMSGQMVELISETEKREEQITRLQTEFSLQIKLLQAQVNKAKIEKAEVKADMTAERLVVSQELGLERDRCINLERTVTLLREQTDLYEKQMADLQQGAGNSSKSFQHFKTQIDKLTNQMGSLERETASWREKSELSTKQVKKMNQVTMEKDKEVNALKKKLESMVKLNKTLSAERSQLLEQIKLQDNSDIVEPQK